MLQSGYERYLVGIKSLKTTIIIIPLVKYMDMIIGEIKYNDKVAVMACSITKFDQYGRVINRTEYDGPLYHPFVYHFRVCDLHI